MNLGNDKESLEKRKTNKDGFQKIPNIYLYLPLVHPKLQDLNTGVNYLTDLKELKTTNCSVEINTSDNFQLLQMNSSNKNVVPIYVSQLEGVNMQGSKFHIHL